jgi:hypothetical protein
MYGLPRICNWLAYTQFRRSLCHIAFGEQHVERDEQVEVDTGQVHELSIQVIRRTITNDFKDCPAPHIVVHVKQHEDGNMGNQKVLITAGASGIGRALSG